VNCDSVRVSQVVSNLLANALTYGDPAEPVSVSAATGLRQFELSVSNAGRPIPAESLERLFMPFARGAAQTGKEGLGLGLYIAFEIARAHGGTLTAKSTALQTEFVFRIPID